MHDTRAVDADALDLLADPLLGPATRSDAPVAAALAVAGVRSRVCAGVSLRVHTDLETLETEWRAFEAIADCTAFQCFDWVSRWQRHIGSRVGARPAVVVGRDADGSILFIFQLAVTRRVLARRLTWLGSELCDYNGPLLSRRFPERVPADRFALLWGEVLALLRTDRALRFDLVNLSKMPAEVGGQPNPFIALGVALDPSGAHLATLGESWDDFYASKRSASTRKRERRQFRQLAEIGEVRLVEPAERGDVEATLDTLFAQKATAFARMGIENFLERPGYREFFKAVATDPETKSLAHTSRLDVGPAMAGTGFALEFRGRYYLLLSSYQDGDLSRYGPGRAHLQALIRRAIERGLSEFDFTVGDEPYKRDWSDVTLSLYGHFAAATPRGWPSVIAALAFRRAKRTIKQNPALWRLYSQARFHLAELRKTRTAPEQGRDAAEE